jgi:hypothetical protein
MLLLENYLFVGTLVEGAGKKLPGSKLLTGIAQKNLRRKGYCLLSNGGTGFPACAGAG